MMTLFKINSVLIATLLFIGTTAHVFAQDPVVVNEKGYAAQGYDAVAYFTDKQAIKGTEEVSCEWAGAMWLFVSEENKEKFLQNPEKYAPQYGGYCAHALSKGKLQNASPTAWTIHEDKLYFSRNKRLNEEWANNIKQNVRRADENWLNLKIRF